MMKFDPDVEYRTNPCRRCMCAIDGSPQDLDQCATHPRVHQDGRPDCPFLKKGEMK